MYAIGFVISSASSLVSFSSLSFFSVLTCSSYNSAVYSTLMSRNYVVFSGNEALIQSQSTEDVLGVSNKSSLLNLAVRVRSDAAIGNLDRLDTNACITRYASNFQANYRHIVLVLNDTSTLDLSFNYTDYNGNTYGLNPYQYANFDGTSTLLLDPTSKNIVGNEMVPYGWICGVAQPQNQARCIDRWGDIDPNRWSPFGKRVSYCLAEKMKPECELQFSLPLILVVLVFNLAKSLILFYIFFFIKDNPLLTIGDAVTSFMNVVDPTTEGLCLMGTEDLLAWDPEIPSQARPPKRLIEMIRIWGMAATGTRWYTCVML
jgi:hypothetical protein